MARERHENEGPRPDDEVEMTVRMDEDTSDLPLGGDTGAERGGARGEKHGGSGDGDDVFVILPEQVEGDIPVVDTEMIDPVDIEDVPLLDRIPGSEDDSEVTTQLEATELVDDDDLDQLASDVGEDDVLMTDVGDDFPSSPEYDADGFSSEELDALDQPPRRRSVIVRWGLPFAAVLVGAVTCWYFVAPASYSRYLPWPPVGGGVASAAGAQGSAGAVGTAGGGDPSVVGVDGQPGEIAGGSSTDESRFRESVLIALKLGFRGEESHE